MKSREARTVAACVAGCLVAWAAGPAAAVTDAERISANQQFREAFDARKLRRGVAACRKVVALTEEQYGEDARALANPLTNLGTVHYRLKDYRCRRERISAQHLHLEQTRGRRTGSCCAPCRGWAPRISRRTIRGRVGRAEAGDRPEP